MIPITNLELTGHPVFIGDIHGMFNKFNDLLDLIYKEVKNPHIVLLGDLVDKGPDSAEVVQMAMDLDLDCVLGNHDEWHVRYRKYILTSENVPNYKNPMKQTYHVDNSIFTQDQIDWIKSRPIVFRFQWEDKIYLATHAGIGPRRFKQKENAFIRNRYLKGSQYLTIEEASKVDSPKFWFESWNGPETVIFGHIQTPKPIIGEFHIGIDTNACEGGDLTAYICGDRFISV